MKKDILDCLFDDDCADDIIVYDEDNNELRLEQVAIIPYMNEMYAILRPLNGECDEDEAWVFLIDEVEEEIVLITDSEIVDAVFDEYNRLLEGQEDE